MRGWLSQTTSTQWTIKKEGMSNNKQAVPNYAVCLKGWGVWGWGGTYTNQNLRLDSPHPLDRLGVLKTCTMKQKQTFTHNSSQVTAM